MNKALASVKRLLIFTATLFLAFSAICQQANMNRRIDIKVPHGERIYMNFNADSSNTPVKIVSGTLDSIMIADTNFTMRSIFITAEDTVITLYGNVKVFRCAGNGSLISEIDISGNSGLKELYCQGNSIAKLTIGNNTSLNTLYAQNNAITSLNLGGCPSLTYFHCGHNNISTLDISGNTALKELFCSHNQLTTIDISNDTLLETLSCEFNSISALDFSGNTLITNIICNSNALCAQAYDNMMCSLPTASGESHNLTPTDDISNTGDAFFNANVANAIAKGWAVRDTNNAMILTTSGTHSCDNSIDESSYVHFTINPNPAKERIAIHGLEAGTHIIIIDMAGKIVRKTVSGDGIAVMDIRGLDSGVYFVKTADCSQKLIVW